MPLESGGGYRKRDDYTGRVFGGGGGGVEHEGILETSLSAPGCLWDQPTSATVQPLRRDPATKALIDPESQSSSSVASPVVVYNSDPDLEAPLGAYCRYRRIGGILQFTYVGCEDALSGCPSSSSTGGV